MIFRLTVLGASLLFFILTYYKQKKHEERLLQLQQYHKVEDGVWYKFIFITNENLECTEHLRQEESCGEKCSHNYLQTIREHLRSAKATISLCIYHVTLVTILEELTDAHSRKIAVRVISDREMDYHHASITNKLREKGIPLKIQRDTQTYMHHKFLLIDENTDDKEVWFGSLNLTAQALTTNWESMMYTNNASMVSDFSKCFDMLWESFTDS